MTIDEIMAAGDQWIPEQDATELRNLVALLMRNPPRNVVEIGVRRGGTIAIWHALCSGIVVGVDLPEIFNTDRHQQLAHQYPRFRSVLSDSHDPSTLVAVSVCLESEPVDFLFIDGDHSYEGVRQDWEMYSPMVRPGGLVGFHDIADTPYMRSVDNNVWRFWQGLDGEKTEFYEGGEFYGIGVVRV